MAYLEIHGLAKGFGSDPALVDVDLSVEAGSLVTILGASGSGKTTLLRLICGFERADAGTIAIDGRTVGASRIHVAPERRRVGYVAQEGALFPHLSVAQNVAFGLSRSQRRVEHRVTELLELVGLPAAFARRAPQTLSGGEQQRVALARALAPAPSLVLLDEPFSALDAARRIETRQAVVAALDAVGATALLVTHDQAEALSLGDRVAVLRRGRLVQVADPVTLYRRPHDAELASFVGEAVVLPAIARGGTLHFALGTVAAPPGTRDGPCDVLVRPEQIHVAPAGALGGTSGVRARVTAATFYGHMTSVALVLASDATVAFTALVAGQTNACAGDDVSLTVEGEVRVFAR